MPNYSGGDLIEVTCNHPTLGDFKFQTKANESYSIDPGGYRGADDSNMVTGGGVNIRQINRVRWSFEGPLMVDFQSNNELLNLPLLATDPVEGDWTFAHSSGEVWRGNGSIVGDIVIDTNTAQLPIKISGGGELQKF